MPATQLFAVSSAEEHWQGVAGPWLRAQAASTWKEVRPTVVLTPNRAEGFYLRSRLVAEGTPLLGVRFWTPSDARKFLLSHYLPKLGTANQAELRLIARRCAERLIAREEVNSASLRSVVREPAAFLRAYDLLLGAGWNPARDGAEYGRELARELQRELESAGIATQAGLHRQLWLQSSASPQRLVANLFVTGFNAAHWPLWDLLKAVALSADQVVIALSQPAVFGEKADQLWCDSWQEFTGEETRIPAVTTSVPDSPFSRLAASYETGSREPLPDLDLTFCVTPDLATQTRAIVLRALEFLQNQNCTRLGIVFPQANALALAVAEELQRLDIPMNDGPGVLVPGPFEKRSWQTWLALQEEPGTPTLIAWLRACEAEGRSFGAPQALPASVVAEIVENALGETLVDDLDFLAGHLEGQTRKPRAREAADFLHARIALPAEATFARFLELTRDATALRGWESLHAELETDPPDWLCDGALTLSRRTFLKWLEEATDSQQRTRGPQSNHFYGRVHLLVYGQLSGQTWSHLILTGLNEGEWPRVFEQGAFGSRHELDALNKQARELNRRARAQGQYGEGHEVVRAAFGHCLLPLERQNLALRDLCFALESTSHAVCLAAMTTAAGRGLLPSDFFNHAYQVKTGSTLDDVRFARMAAATQEWCRRSESLFDAGGATPQAPLENLRAVHDMRRDPRQPFGRYEFAFEEPPARPVQLSCKQWESAWDHPSHVWLESVVGASTWPVGELSWPRAIGTWVHVWLSQALDEYRKHSATSLVPLVQEIAERIARRTRERCAATGIELYPWWEQVRSQALSIAIGLAENLDPVLRERHFASEYRIPSGLAVALPGSEHADFELRGRIDLLLFKPGAASIDPAAPVFSGMPCWVIDFKTGSARALTSKDTGEGRGLQPLLYALAMRALGAGNTTISLLARNAVLKEQLDLDEALQNAALFQSLEIMHRGGIFGMTPDAENDYGFAPSYPLATRFIPKYVLDAKWARTHGGLPAEDDDDA